MIIVIITILIVPSSLYITRILVPRSYLIRITGYKFITTLAADKNEETSYGLRKDVSDWWQVLKARHRMGVFG
jgi:hypothetical protein